MKKFDNFDDAFKWIDKSIKDVKPTALEIVTEEAYKDSRPYVYIDDGTMYESGQIYSDFKKGEVIMRTPYVRVRYYLGGEGRKNPNAIPMWFETSTRENMSKYAGQYAKALQKGFR